MTDTEVLRHSVTADDYADSPRSMLYVMYPEVYGSPAIPALPGTWPMRDVHLIATLSMEAMWASSVAKVIAKCAALGWEIEDTDDSERRTARVAALLHAADGGGWVSFVQRHLQDYLLTDNGAFVEVVRATGAAGSRIIGLAHLDSLRCARTNDPDIPVLYRDLLGRQHELKAHQVLMLTDMPSPRAEHRRRGMCGAARAYPTIRKLAALEGYVYEKISGDGATGLTFISGISERNLRDAIVTADEAQKSRGGVYYKGKILVPLPSPDTAPGVAEIALKDLPDGWDSERERTNAYTIYANALGATFLDIAPIRSEGLGTGTQARVIDEGAQGYGLAVWRKAWGHLFNTFVAPATTTFTWSNANDLRDQEAQARVEDIRAGTRAKRIASGEISPAMAQQLALDIGDLPPELAGPDTTAAGVLGDEQKPMSAEQIATDEAAPPTYPLPEVDATAQIVYPTLAPPAAPALKADEPTAAMRRRADKLAAKLLADTQTQARARQIARRYRA